MEIRKKTVLSVINGWEVIKSRLAILCGGCSFGNKKDNCAKCDKWMGGNKTLAHVCNSCGFGNKKSNCVKCGKWAPWLSNQSCK